MEGRPCQAANDGGAAGAGVDREAERAAALRVLAERLGGEADRLSLALAHFLSGPSGPLRACALTLLEALLDLLPALPGPAERGDLIAAAARPSVVWALSFLVAAATRPGPDRLAEALAERAAVCLTRLSSAGCAGGPAAAEAPWATGASAGELTEGCTAAVGGGPLTEAGASAGELDAAAQWCLAALDRPGPDPAEPLECLRWLRGLARAGPAARAAGNCSACYPYEWVTAGVLDRSVVKRVIAL